MAAADYETAPVGHSVILRLSVSARPIYRHGSLTFESWPKDRERPIEPLLYEIIELLKLNLSTELRTVGIKIRTNDGDLAADRSSGHLIGSTIRDDQTIDLDGGIARCGRFPYIEAKVDERLFVFRGKS